MADRQAELKVTVVRDHDDECSVVATIRAGSFSGSGRAWLHIADVSEFAASVKRLSGTSQGEATLRGGYVNSDGSPNPTVNIQLSPQGVRGHIAIVAELASGPPASNAVMPFVRRARLAATSRYGSSTRPIQTSTAATRVDCPKKSRTST